MKFIAETAFNHEGDFEYLTELVKQVAKTGADYVKFQVLIKPHQFVSIKSSAFETVKSWCFSQQQWLEIFELTEQLGLKLFLMPLDLEAVELCKRDTVEFIEIHSVCFNNIALIEAAKKLNKKIVYGVGGRNRNELEVLANDPALSERLIFMHGFQSYPTDLEDAKLARMKYLVSLFPHVPVGYADHSSPDNDDSLESLYMAYSIGVRLFEKHVTLEKTRTDADSAVFPKQLAFQIEKLQRCDVILNQPIENAFSLNDKEIKYRNRQQQVVVTKKIKKGTVFTDENTCLAMHSEIGGFSETNSVLNQIAPENYDIGDLIKEDALL